MSEIYSYQKDKFHIHSQYKELWKLVRSEGKYIPSPSKQISIMNNQKYSGKIRNNICYFDGIGYEIRLPYQNYQIQWKANKNIKIGFYSPCRKLGTDLYLNVDENNKLAKYRDKKGIIIIKFGCLVVHSFCSKENVEIELKIAPIIINDYCKLDVFHNKTEGIFQYNILRTKYQKVVQLIKEYYQQTAIHLKLKSGKLPTTSDYNNILAKSSYQNIFSVTTQIKPVSDRDGFYGIIVKRETGIVSSATINYQITISNNILPSPDVIVIAAYYDGNNYIVHRVNNTEVINDHPFPVNNIVIGKLLLESTATDVTLIVTNSLYGLLPIDGQNPDTIINFDKVEISYDSIDR